MEISNEFNNTIRSALLEQQLLKTISEVNLELQHLQIQTVLTKLNISLEDYAAALLFLFDLKTNPVQPKPIEILGNKPKNPNYRFVRYRLDVGSQHNVAREHIQAVLVEESGVDKNRIGKIDIRPNYTLVELPDGMPADIFQLLSEASIGERKLAIKRVKTNRKGLKN